MVATAISNCCNTRLFSSTPACGIEVGINRKVPSSKEGINSFPVFFIIINPKTTIAVGIERNKDRKSTRLNSSHVAISYAVFCLKQKNRKGHSRKIQRY